MNWQHILDNVNAVGPSGVGIMHYLPPKTSSHRRETHPRRPWSASDSCRMYPCHVTTIC